VAATDFTNPKVTQNYALLLADVREQFVRSVTQFQTSDPADSNIPNGAVKFDSSSAVKTWQRYDGSSFTDLVGQGERIRFGANAVMGDWQSSNTAAFFGHKDHLTTNYAVVQAADGETRLNTGTDNLRFNVRSQVTLRLSNNATTNEFRPEVSEATNLGRINRKWNTTFTKDLSFSGQLFFEPQTYKWSFFPYNTLTSLNPAAATPQNNADAINTLWKMFTELGIGDEI